MDNQSKLGQRIAERMEDLNLNAEVLAQKVGVSATTVRDWKRGKYQIFMTHLIRIADALECSIEFLIGRSESVLDFTPQECPPFYERLRALMKEENISRYRIVKDTRLGDASFSEWKKGKEPHLSSLIELSVILDCSIDYLVGREQ